MLYSNLVKRGHGSWLKGTKVEYRLKPHRHARIHEPGEFQTDLKTDPEA
jgi:hypothetical protein